MKQLLGGNDGNTVIRLVRIFTTCILLLLSVFTIITGSYLLAPIFSKEAITEEPSQQLNPVVSDTWQAPIIDKLVMDSLPEIIKYGRELVVHTAAYLGPNGSVTPISNGMNCKNCHLDGGTRIFGINFSAVAANYPIWRDRSGTRVDVKERINECIERSLNGTRLDSSSKELEAMASYILWIGKDVPKGTKPYGAGMKQIAYLDRPADPIKGKIVYENHCLLCHDQVGNGVMDPNGMEWLYPPIFGNQSYNNGAGMYRISKFASFVKYNMPYGISHDNPTLTDEEAWDVAAYVNSLPRPDKDQRNDWPDLSTKPIDHPFGPYADDYSEAAHKYGPYKKMLSR
ncbi:MAG: c-type cytochrome [Cyclobacteriaceae bacterium]